MLTKIRFSSLLSHNFIPPNKLLINIISLKLLIVALRLQIPFNNSQKMDFRRENRNFFARFTL